MYRNPKVRVYDLFLKLSNNIAYVSSNLWNCTRIYSSLFKLSSSQPIQGKMWRQIPRYRDGDALAFRLCPRSHVAPDLSWDFHYIRRCFWPLRCLLPCVTECFQKWIDTFVFLILLQFLSATGFIINLSVPHYLLTIYIELHVAYSSHALCILLRILFIQKKRHYVF